MIVRVTRALRALLYVTRVLSLGKKSTNQKLYPILTNQIAWRGRLSKSAGRQRKPCSEKKLHKTWTIQLDYLKLHPLTKGSIALYVGPLDFVWSMVPASTDYAWIVCTTLTVCEEMVWIDVRHVSWKMLSLSSGQVFLKIILLYRVKLA